MSLSRLSKFLKQKKDLISLALGEFNLIKPIGQGGNGIVYEAELHGKTLAMKFLITDATGKTKQDKLNRFIAEYFNIITLEDLTNIVRYIDFDLLVIQDETGQLEIPVIVMKKYDCSLEILQQSKSIEGLTILFHFLLNALEKIHKSGIIHRDIKPQNILVKNETLVLADFGIANYNPKIFNIRAKTEKKERLGNRLFSAPEQEESGIDPHPSMDIYAMGQVLQWYATGKTHRGTGRKLISEIFEDSNEIDNVVEKCLENTPSNRFQSIAEVRAYLKSYHDRKREPDVWGLLNLFHQICQRNFPKNEFGIVHSSDIIRIDQLFKDFQQNQGEMANKLWWHNGTSNSSFILTQSGSGIWKMDFNQYSIKEIWIHYDSRHYNDYILIHYAAGEPFIIEGQTRYYTGIVDGEHYISNSEWESGFGEINGKIVKLDNHKSEFIERQENDGYLFIGMEYHCILRKANDWNVRDFIQHIEHNPTLGMEKFEDFTWKIMEHKHFLVEEGLCLTH